MIKSRLFVRFAGLGIVISIIVMVMSFFTVKWIRELSFNEPIRTHGQLRFTEALLSRIAPQDRVSALGEANREDVNPKFLDIYLTDADGKILFPPNTNPSEAEQIRNLALHGASKGFRVARLDGSPTQYFVRSLQLRGPSPPPPRRGFLVMNLIQVAAIVIAVVLTLLALAYSLRGRAHLAEQVISDLAQGNLKARFPITKLDEVGQMMISFNKMADQVEHLVESLRKTESARKDLLKQLAHDLRTPIASMKSLIETVKDKSEKLSQDQTQSLLGLAMQEAEYFEGLVDDLLFLGRVDEPRFQEAKSHFNLVEMTEDEIESVSHRYNGIVAEIIAPIELPFECDAGLMKRMIRNILENAFSFAKTKVLITLSRLPNGEIEIRVLDDGPGFDPQALENFGKRKFSRATTDRTKRISIGLGSVIIKSIVEAYRGQLVVGNHTTQGSDQSRGAEITVRFPAA